METLTMIGAGATEFERTAVARALEREGLAGPCEASIGAQGEGFSIIVISASVNVFMAVFAQPVLENAREHLRRFFEELHDARNDRDGRRRQLYVRPNAVTPHEWGQTKPQGRMPGWHREGSNEPELLIEDSIPDEAWEALFELDFGTLPGGLYSWRVSERRWVRADFN